MSKELPYFKFEPSEWTHGNIQMCSFEAKASFIELCCLYWNRLGDCSIQLATALSCNRKENIFSELVDCNIIQTKGDSVIINFLDIQLKEFNIVKKTRAESGRKGGQKGGVRPSEERKKGNQIYIIECWNKEERFYKIGTTSSCVSRRYSGKIQYEYKLVFHLFTDDFLDAEKTICETLANYEYKPKLNFAGQKECYLYDEYQHIESAFNNYFKFAQASLKRTEAIREDKSKEDKSITPINWEALLSLFNKTVNKKSKVISKKVKDQINARLKEGYSKDDIKATIKNCVKDDFHIGNNFKYVTLEYISRSQTIDKYSNIEINVSGKSNQITQTYDN